MLTVGTRYKRYKKLCLILVSIKQIFFLTLESELRFSEVESELLRLTVVKLESEVRLTVGTLQSERRLTI